MALIKPTADQTRTLKKRLIKWHSNATSNGHKITTIEAHRMLFSVLSELGIADVNIAKGRSIKPNYAELGMTRKAGPPTDEDIANYAQVTDGAKLDKNGLVVQCLMFDNNLITDRAAVMTQTGLSEMLGKYMGRANDFNHSFNVEHARCRIIGLGIGYDPNYPMHSDRPTANMVGHTASYYDGVYMALYATLAFPSVQNDNTIEKVLSGLIKDESVAFSNTPGTSLCSECMKPLTHSYCYTMCDEHGYVGGRTEEGRLICNVMTSVADAFTFGLVSDGAVPNAGIVLDPEGKGDEPEEDTSASSVQSLTLPKESGEWKITWHAHNSNSVPLTITSCDETQIN